MDAPTDMAPGIDGGGIEAAGPVVDMGGNAPDAGGIDRPACAACMALICPRGKVPRGTRKDEPTGKFAAGEDPGGGRPAPGGEEAKGDGAVCCIDAAAGGTETLPPQGPVYAMEAAAAGGTETLPPQGPLYDTGIGGVGGPPPPPLTEPMECRGSMGTGTGSAPAGPPGAEATEAVEPKALAGKEAETSDEAPAGGAIVEAPAADTFTACGMDGADAKLVADGNWADGNCAATGAWYPGGTVTGMCSMRSTSWIWVTGTSL
mmetsp:Transcript_81326/g.205500  ORF Transcript_81326/g.205500 Transcript_81326/m.205500 type:complete len:261 (-) Transcript_81326:1119-1901(-)